MIISILNAITIHLIVLDFISLEPSSLQKNPSKLMMDFFIEIFSNLLRDEFLRHFLNDCTS